MKIEVERGDWTARNPELVVLVADPYSDFAGKVPESLQSRLDGYAQGFAEGKLRREIGFSEEWGGRRLDFLYFHTSTEKGFTSTETLKTFLSKALHLASDTGRTRVALLLGGEHGENLIDQAVEGALIGTFGYRAYKKDQADPFEAMELTLCLPTPQPSPTVFETEPEGNSSTEIVADAVAESVESAEEVSEEAAVEESEPVESGEPVEAEESESEVAQLEEPVETTVSEQAATIASSPTSVLTPEPTVAEEVWEALRQSDDSAVRVGRAFGEAVNFARTLVAMPGCDCTPDYLSKTAKKLAATHGFSFQSFGLKALADHNYIGLLTVGKGSDNTPRMMELTYTPKNESDVHLVLLGKGVTFDTGGISIKPSENMHLMVGDMAGAAAVLGAMDVIGRLRPEIKVTAIVVSAENKPGSKACRPGDIIRYKNGLSVHIDNTDAEGRLILADGLIRAGELQATHIVDVATLTGACSRALGPSFTGVMGANRKLVNAITRAGGNHGESYWRLPLPLEYKEMLKTPHADLNNVGGPNAGATTAGLFLKEFVPGNTPWVHLDIAGTFWKSKAWKYYKEGPSGTAVKTLADLALRWKEHLG